MQEMNPYKQLADNLRAAKALIDTPAKWIQGNLAHDAEGRNISLYDPNATCFCSMGAYARFCFDTQPGFVVRRLISNALDKAAQEATGTHNTNVALYNDSHGHAEVMALWDRAIATAEANAAAM